MHTDEHEVLMLLQAILSMATANKSLFAGLSWCSKRQYHRTGKTHKDIFLLGKRKIGKYNWETRSGLDKGPPSA